MFSMRGFCNLRIFAIGIKSRSKLPQDCLPKRLRDHAFVHIGRR